jgi:hypothetical protein
MPVTDTVLAPLSVHVVWERSDSNEGLKEYSLYINKTSLSITNITSITKYVYVLHKHIPHLLAFTSWNATVVSSLYIFSYIYIYIYIYLVSMSQDSAVGISSGYGLDDRGVGVRVPVGSRIFSKSSRPALGSTQPPIQWVRGTLSLWVRRSGREADHSPPASAEIKKVWIHTSTLPYAFMA